MNQILFFSIFLNKNKHEIFSIAVFTPVFISVSYFVNLFGLSNRVYYINFEMINCTYYITSNYIITTLIEILSKYLNVESNDLIRFFEIGISIRVFLYIRPYIRFFFKI
jgi:hypothetical protein